MDTFDDNSPTNNLKDVGKFIEAVLRDPETMGDHLLATLEANKVEAEYQDYDKPRIFFRECDDYGLTVSVAVNPYYGDTIPMPKVAFTPEDRAKIPQLLQMTSDATLLVFLLTNQLEKVIFATLMEVTTADVSPPIKKSFNKRGFPTRYQINWNVEHQTAFHA